jgi:hypothetical protein
MATSTALEDRVVSEIKRLCNAGLDQRALLGEVAERLRRAIPSEAFCLSATDPSSELVTYGTAEGLGGIRGMRLFFEHIYLETLHLRVHRPGSSLQHIRQGRSTRSRGPHKAALLR